MLLLCRAPMEDGSLAPSLAPTVSILVPCFEAAATIGKAVGSALAQTFDDIEVVLASDDGEDYAALSGCADPRLRQVSTGRAGSGDGPARNAALAAARGRFVANLDADDTMRPERLAFMLPFAERCGAALDNTALWIDGRLAKTAFPPAPADFRLTAGAILAPRLPMNALLRRELAGAGWRAFDFCSDVVFNLELLSRCPEFRGLARTGYDYAKRDGSITQAPDTADRAARGYAAIIAAIDAGGLDLTPGIAAAARREFAANARANEAFRAAQRAGEVENLEAWLAS